MIKTWDERCEQFDNGVCVTNAIIQFAMQAEIDELRAALPTWINREDQEPNKDAGRILVFGIGWPEGVIAVRYDYGDWCDVVDKVSVEFKYWQPAPKEPECGN